jgi:hypothetical protein
MTADVEPFGSYYQNSVSETVFCERNGRLIVLQRTINGKISKLTGRKRLDALRRQGWGYDRKLRKWIDPLADEDLDDWSERWLAANPE